MNLVILHTERSTGWGGQEMRTVSEACGVAARGHRVIIVASQGGAPKSPVWHANLVKNPDIEAQYKGRKMKLRARRVDDAEKASLWPICCEHYPPFDDYQKRTDRNIPVYVCEPR